ncbi:MAG: hypothetical protein O3A00_02615 [Planctomycetota bacterium]|nr:hypothetical protein [Planctomycetota bacterium]
MHETLDRLKFHPHAYHFVFAALRFTQQELGKVDYEIESPDAHISGPELLDGFRLLAIQQFGLMAMSVLNHWGIRCTDDVGRIVFELVERGDMRKTDNDQLNDFVAVYEFADVFDADYKISTAKAFKPRD